MIYVLEKQSKCSINYRLTPPPHPLIYNLLIDCKKKNTCIQINHLFLFQGGLKAVVWTDTLQTILMMAGVVCVLVIGTVKLGGPSVVFERNLQTGRLDFLKYAVKSIYYVFIGVLFTVN